MPPSSTPEPCTIVAYVLRDDADPANPTSPPTQPVYRPAMIVSRNTDDTVNLLVFQNGYADHGVEDDDGHWWPGLLPRKLAAYGPDVGQWLEPGDIDWADFDLDPADVDDAFPEFPNGPSDTFSG